MDGAEANRRPAPAESFSDNGVECMGTRIASSLVLLVLVFAGCSRTGASADVAQEAITSEEARTALLRLDSLRVITGNVNDPIFKEIKAGAVVQEDSTTWIGHFIRCDLQAKTWRMSISAPKMHLDAEAEGVVERQADGSWLAATKRSLIS
jgi:hypothetical protein